MRDFEVATHGSPALVLFDQSGKDRAELNINSKGKPGLALADETPAKPLADGDFKIGPPYKDAPELTVKDDVPKGALHEFTMTSEESKIYPGLKGAYKRKVAVYVPKQYKEGATAPFIVVQDGLSYTGTLTKILDNLIHERRLPAMVAIFITSFFLSYAGLGVAGVVMISRSSSPAIRPPGSIRPPARTTES